VSVASEDPFNSGAAVTFEAIAQQTYYFAVDTKGGLGGDFLIRMNFPGINRENMDPYWVVAEPGQSWEFLYVSDPVTHDPVNPASVNVDLDGNIVNEGEGQIDGDFNTTWQQSSGYDGPAFSEPSPAPLGYGEIASYSLASDIWGQRNGNLIPRFTGERSTAYFRRTFIASSPIHGLAFEGLFDDGAIIYINGVEVARVNATSQSSNESASDHCPSLSNF